MMSVAEVSASAERRKALKEADAANQLRVLGSCPLSKYINIADRLLDHFQDAVDGRRLDEAYIFGLRFSNLCLSSLPQHPEWKHDMSTKGRKRLTSQVGDVLCMMGVIKQRMDAEEMIKMKAQMIARQEEEKEKREAENYRKHQLDEERKREQKILDALNEERAHFLAEQRDQRENKIKQTKAIENKIKSLTKSKEIEKSAMAKLEAMQAKISLVEEDTAQTAKVSQMSFEQPIRTKTKTKGGKDQKWFCLRNKKPKEEKSSLPLARPTQSSVSENDTTASFAADTAEEFIVKGNLDQSAELKLSIGDTNILNTITANSAGKIENETKSENNNKNISITVSTKTYENESPPDTISDRSYLKLSNECSDSIRSTKSNEGKLKSFVKSKIVAAKSMISTEPLTTVMPSSKVYVNDSVKNSAASIAIAQQTPRSRKEKATIKQLKRAISVQEDRLTEIEEKQIPCLLRTAKSFLKEDNKQEALKCLAHKKRLERLADTIKAAVFNMETQMFMLESAYEDRHVKKALDEAATAIAGFEQNVGDPNAEVLDLANMRASLPELDVGGFTDEELMEELEHWLSPEVRRKAMEMKDSHLDDDDISLLSMPVFLPSAPVAAIVSSPVDRILEAVIDK